jgi:hypothetical protein
MSTLRQIIELGNEAIKQMEKLEEQKADLEKRLNYMREGFRRLLEEEDITSLPSFHLLRMTYGEYLDNPTVRAAKLPEQPIYDPMFMPPSMRRSMKTRVIAKPTHAQAHVASDAPKPEPEPPSSTPDFSQNLLEEPSRPAPKKISIKAKSAPSSSEAIIAKGSVYRLELQGIIYYLYGQYLYDTETRKRVGSIVDDTIEVCGKTLSITYGDTVPLKDIGDGLLLAADDKAYRPLTGLLAQSVGIYKDGELGAWA